MEGRELADQFKLDITILSNDRSREVALKPSAGNHLKERQVIIWTRKCDLTERVYVDESSRGELRVVKRVPWRDRTVVNYRSELEVMERVSTSGAQKKLFVDFIGWFPATLSDHIYFVMEYCRLGDISKCYPNPLSESETRSICEQLLEALALLHELGITHRDVKPQNVLVVEKNPVRVKLADFGISKLAREDETELRTRIGTEGYMAPEVFGLLDDSRESSSYTSAVDIWSLGCLIYYVMTKLTPFSTFLSLQAYAKGDAAFPESPLYGRGVSLGGRAFIQRLLLPSPGARPKASKQLLADWIVGNNATPDPLPAPDLESLADSPPQPPPSHGNSSSEAERGPMPPHFPTFAPEIDYFSSELWHVIENTKSLMEILEATHNGGSFLAAKEHAEWLVKRKKFSEPSTDRLRVLLDAGANPNILVNNYTALHLATIKGYTGWVKILLQYGADMKIRTGKDRHPVLHLAVTDVHRGHWSLSSRMIEFLLDQGADPDTPNLLGHTLLHKLIHDAAPHQMIHIHQTAYVSGLIRSLMVRGVSTKLKTLDGHTSLGYAITLRKQRIAILLLDNGFGPNTLDCEGRTPLHLAVAGKEASLELVRRLIKAGASVNQEDAQKHTPLFIAARSGVRSEVIDTLLNYGADCKIEDPVVMKRIRRVKFWRKMKGSLFNIR